jgi:hypothetical protein
MTRLKGKSGGLLWLWVLIAIIVIGAAVLGLDYFDVWQLGLY